MRLRALLPALLASCAPPPPAPVVVAPAPAPPPPPAAVTSEPVVARPSRRGECDLGQALDAFLTGQEAVRCSDLPWRPARDDYERARACVVAASHARKPFALVMNGRRLDSVMRNAVAARRVGDGYEVRWFSYDSCPSGCGVDDPVWSSVRCEPLVDLRAACASLGRRKKKTPADRELGWLCDEDGVEKSRRELELRCDGRSQVEGCGAVR